VLSLAMKGNQMKGIALKDPKRLYDTSHDRYFKDLLQGHPPTGEEPAAYLYKMMAETVSGADYIFEQSKIKPASGNYPDTEIGKSFKTIASLILSDINTKIYYVSHGSFDTHVNQDARQTKLFSEMNDAIKVFTTDLKLNNRFSDVLLMTFSEFGRRVSQNASGGTDHGTANNMFLIGGALQRKGILNDLPDLANLNNGDLTYSTDFKNVYATVLKNWLKADDRQILGKSYDCLDFI
jgi:uncharacterized protein (DUF1501 family)